MANLRVKKKHLDSDAIDGSKLKLLQGEAVRVVDANGVVAELVKLDANGNVVGNGHELAKKSDLNAESTSRRVAIADEATARAAADQDLQDALDLESLSRQQAISDEESARIAGDLTEQSLRVAAVEAEASARSVADEILLAGLDAETSARTAGDEALQNGLAAEVTSRQTAVSAEESRAVAAELSLQAAISAETTSRQQAIADLVNSAPAVLDTLKELADALGGDEDFATTIANRFNTIETSLAEAEAGGADYTDQKVQEVLDLISQTLIKHEVVTITEAAVQAGFVALTATNVISGSMTASIDRLSVFENEDFSLSVVNGVTRMTFLNSFAAGGNEAVEAGEQLRLTYWSLS